jgi:hypothetical protein
MFIYVITNNITGKIYIGQHKGANLQQYLQKKFYHARNQKTGSSYLFNAMRKHPDYKDWSIEPLISDVQTREALDAWEITLIESFQTRNPEIGYNLCKGGEGFTGVFTPEHRAKIGAAAKAWFLNPDNANAIKIRNSKLSDSKKIQYADHWVTKICPECGKSFSQPMEFKRVKLCSQVCNYQHNQKNNKKWVENRRKVVQSAEYRSNHSKVMKRALEYKRGVSLAAYYAHPSYCLHCGSRIEMVEGGKLSVMRKRKFCNISCSAKEKAKKRLLNT